jgi:hypothetical protein
VLRLIYQMFSMLLGWIVLRARSDTSKEIEILTFAELTTRAEPSTDPTDPSRIPRTRLAPAEPPTNRHQPRPYPERPDPGDTQPDRLTAQAHYAHDPRRHSGRRAAEHPKLSPRRSLVKPERRRHYSRIGSN